MDWRKSVEEEIIWNRFFVIAGTPCLSRRTILLSYLSLSSVFPFEHFKNKFGLDKHTRKKIENEVVVELWLSLNVLSFKPAWRPGQQQNSLILALTLHQ